MESLTRKEGKSSLLFEAIFFHHIFGLDRLLLMTFTSVEMLNIVRK